MPDCVITVVVRQLTAPCFASCTDESETWKTEKGSAKDLSKSVGTVKLKVTNSAGAKLMNMKAPEFAADLQEVSDQLDASKPAPQLVVNKR